MIFNNVKTFTVPDGVVNKVSFDDVVLWEASPIFPSWYKCDPVISINYESKNIADTNRYRCGFICRISGITRQLIVDVQIIGAYYRDTASGMPVLQQSQYPCELPESENTEDDYVFLQYLNYTVPSALYYGHKFALRITYMDLDGSKKILTTDYLSSVGTGSSARD